MVSAQFTLFGRLSVFVDGHFIRPTPGTAAVLARLLLADGRLVTTEELLLAMRPNWRGIVRREQRVAVQQRIAELRRLFDAGRAGTSTGLLRTDRGAPTAYGLTVSREQLDLFRFEDLVSQAQASHGPQAEAMLRQALSLWTDRPLLGIEDREFASEVVDRLQRLRADATAALSTLLGVREAPVAGGDGLISASPEPLSRLPRPAQLPHGLPDFVGREAELCRLTVLARSDTTVMIAALTGTAGVGKTSLAVRWAHQVSHQFPDGQLYVNLRGFDPQGPPVDPGTVLRGFLDAFGVAAQQIPSAVEDQAARYRSLLAGRRVLVVLDNARNTEQVRPLLPGTSGCVVVVTSRNRLSGLVAAGAIPVTLDLLTAEESTALLGRRIGADRVATEPEAAAEVVAACARLPLALAIVAARAAPYPQYRLSALAAELRQARGGLDAFIGEAESGDIRAVLSWSCQQLSAAAARLFRLLALHPGPEITPPAAASLAGVAVRPVRRLLAELSGAHVLEERTPGRFAFHDLLRAYAAEQVHDVEPESERRAATRRFLDHNLHSAHAANRILYPYREPIAIDPPDPATTVLVFVDQSEALAWFTTEYAVLLATIDRATDVGFTVHTSRLTWTVTAFLNYQGKWHDWAGCLLATLRACRQCGDHPGEAWAYRLLNVACLQRGMLDEAYAHARHALEMFGQLGDRARQARLHLDLGRVSERRGDRRAALQRARRALALFQEAGHRDGEADALNWMGRYQCQLGNHVEALRYCQESLSVHRKEVSGWPGQADTWDTLGLAHHHLRHYDEAIACYDQALALWRDLGDRYEVATTSIRLGNTRHAAGEPHSARTLWQQAKAILDDLGHPQADQLWTRLNPDGAQTPTMEGETTMSEQEPEAKHGRLAAVVVAGSLAACAALGMDVVATEHGTSVRDQFRCAFTPGAINELAPMDPSPIVIRGE